MLLYFLKARPVLHFEDLKRELDNARVKDDDYSNNGIIIINRIVMSGEEFDRFIGEEEK